MSVCNQRNSYSWKSKSLIDYILWSDKVIKECYTITNVLELCTKKTHLRRVCGGCGVKFSLTNSTTWMPQFSISLEKTM